MSTSAAAQKSFPKASMPCSAVAEELQDTYWKKFHARHPFLRRKEMQALNKQRHELVEQRKREQERAPGQINGQIFKRSVSVSLFKLNMVFAIASRYLQLSQNYDHETNPEVKTPTS